MGRVPFPARTRIPSPAPAAGSRPSLPRRIGPGLLLSLAVGAFTLALSHIIPAASPALVAIVLGTLAANTVLRRPATEKVLLPGLRVSSRTVLRIGIALLGLQLALGDVLELGPLTLLTVVAVVGLGMGAGLLAGRLLHLPLTQTILVSCGFSICGAAAVAAASSALEGTARGARDDREQDRSVQAERGGVQLETQTATAIALVVLFGTLMIPLVPLLAVALDLPAPGSGTWAGASILEVAQVVAAGSMMGTDALGTAVLVKLARVLMLAPVIAIVTAVMLRAASTRRGSAEHRDDLPQEGGSPARVDRARPPIMPMFVLAFLVAVGVRSLGIVPSPALDLLSTVQALLLASAMFALGTGLRADLLRQVGGRPVALAAILAVVVLAVGLAGALVAV